MPIIKLLNGSQRTYDSVVSIIEIAKDIKLSLATSCIAGIVNGKLVDVNTVIKDNANVIIISNIDNTGLEIIRYSCATLLAYTIKKIWPKAKIANNDFTKNGFYCDIDIDHSIQINDIKLIEKNMLDLIKRNFHFIKKRVKWQDAYNLFLHENEIYKIFMLKNIFKNKKNIDLYCYDNYFDICTNVQVPKIRFCRYLQLETVSGAYWQGNSNNKMLQRIYGTAWNNKTIFQQYSIKLEQAKKRDHRKISKKLDLYHMQDEAPGMVFWHNNGWIVFKELENFIREKLIEYNYQEVKTPIMMDQCIWEKSGHLKNYFESIFTTSSENREYCIKPMNCPGHVQIFNHKLRSYRELPLRIAEFGSCHRNEFSGALHGLMRVRGFTQDDAHIFCTEDQIQKEINHCISMIYDIYKTFGFEKISVKLSTRPKKRIGSDIMWDRAENNLIAILKKNNLLFEYQVGEGAFYGPKIEFILHDCLERLWQCGTIQLDFYLPNCLNTSYIDR
ncbi:MAG TPA: threonine--tRNA ligase, partial [Buchnera sp. (in: enterobacteria)]|nr:threonine--tRNA ligase [Buchnera sp. (in: enterobacteria)]